jgi:hypothetical protein
LQKLLLLYSDTTSTNVRTLRVFGVLFKKLEVCLVSGKVALAALVKDMVYNCHLSRSVTLELLHVASPRNSHVLILEYRTLIELIFALTCFLGVDWVW